MKHINKYQKSIVMVTALALFAISLPFTVSAQEYGRGSLDPEKGSAGSGLGKGPLTRSDYKGDFLGGTCGVKVDLVWAKADWSIGPAEGSGSGFVPMGSIFYKATDTIDINLSFLFLSSDDDDETLGATGTDFGRIAVGVRNWFCNQSRIVPYVGGGIGYYILDGTLDKTYAENNIDTVPANVDMDGNSPGAFLECGMAFQITDNFYIDAVASYDFLL